MRFIDRAKRALLGTSQKTRVVSLVSLCFAFIAFGAAAVAPGTPPDTRHIAFRMIEEEVSLPSLDRQLDRISKEQQFYTREERIRAGDSLNTLFSRLGINDKAAADFIRTDTQANDFLHLKAGQVIHSQTDNRGQLYMLSATLPEAGDHSHSTNIVLTRTDSGFSVFRETERMERTVEMRSGIIQSSLFAATDAAGVPDAVTRQFIELFSTDINFNSDLKRGDRFNIVYETFWQNGKFLKTGNILAAELTNDGTPYQSIWFERSPKKGGYYDFNGKSQKKAFLKYPLEFSRMSSGFSMRVHPVTGRVRQHKGIDFAAPTGTPIRAAADGVIHFSGWQSGYGNFIVLKHWGPYSTAYGHMSRIAAGMTKGKKVSQGDIIGYVGSTGLSTGPHLHYEFRVNNVQQNPATVDMPNVHPLTAREMIRFKTTLAGMKHRFALMDAASASRQIAYNKHRR